MPTGLVIFVVIILIILIREYIIKRQQKCKKEERRQKVQAYKNKIEKNKVDGLTLKNAIISERRNEERNAIDMPNQRRVTYARGPERAYI